MFGIGSFMVTKDFVVSTTITTLQVNLRALTNHLARPWNIMGQPTIDTDAERSSDVFYYSRRRKNIFESVAAKTQNIN